MGLIGSDPLRTMGTYSFEFSAKESDNLSFATMFVQSNDWFIGPLDEGLPLFRNGVPTSGEITDEMPERKPTSYPGWVLTSLCGNQVQTSAGR